MAIPDDGEIITVHRVPVKRLLDEVEAFRDEKGFEIDARLHGLALGLQFGDVKQHKPPGTRRGSWGWTTLASGLAAFLLYRYITASPRR